MYSGILLLLLLGAHNAQAVTVLSGPNLVLQSQGSLNAITKQPDGKMLIGGRFSYVNGVARNNLARLNVDGSVDLSWDPNVDNSVQAIAVDSNGNVYIGGGFLAVGGQSRYGLARINGTTGVVDSWHPTTGGQINALVLDQGAGKLFVGGNCFYDDNQVGTIYNLSR
jgi:hypothetical protein